MNELDALFRGFGEAYKEASEKQIKDELAGKSNDYKVGYLNGRLDGINAAIDLNNKIFKDDTD